MESYSGPGSEGGPHSYSMKNYPSRSRRTRNIQGTLMFVMFTTHFHWAASKRNESIISPRTIGPWNKTLYKIERRCEDFHYPNASSYYYLWPEDDPHFDHCCSYDEKDEMDNPRFYNFQNFSYGIHGPPLTSAIYYDLGLIDQCLPYWKIGCLLQRFYENDLYILGCEFTDLRRLYSRRFWKGSVLKHGLLRSTIPFILSLEILVIIFVGFYWYIWRPPGDGLKHLIKGVTSKDWFWAIRKTLLADWTHLCLLAIIGNGLIEAMGHQDPYSSQSVSFYNFSLLYVVLTFLVWINSFLQQLSYWVSEIEDHYHLLPGAEHSQVYKPLASREACATKQRSQSSRQPHVSKNLEEKIGLNADWKWQPIAAQVGVLFCLWGFLTNVQSDGQGLFELVVAVAGPWSGWYALRVIGYCIYFIVNLRMSIAEKRRQRIRRVWHRLMRRVKHVGTWRRLTRGTGGQAEHCDAQPEEPAPLLRVDGIERL